jgi:alkaline phosphatase
MTKRAIELTSDNPKEFFLVIESGRIDHAHHANNAYNALNETVELSAAVQAALDLTNSEETLVTVTSDHGHVMTMSGYPKRGIRFWEKWCRLERAHSQKIWIIFRI